LKFQYNPPFIIKQVFPEFCWKSKTDKILLTFDDGPVYGNTEKILEVLNDYKIRSLFFCVGNNLFRNPSLAAEILKEGHIIGNHTYNHSKITNSDFDEHAEIDQFNELAEDKLGVKIKYFRPPHGRFNLMTGKLLRKKNLTNVMWSLLTYDFKGNSSLVKYSVINYLEKNSIIVLHDNVKSQDIILDSIKFIANEALGRGFRFGEPEECLK
jgi:peptidoglycan-N-acetylglucosamine deacetylase